MPESADRICSLRPVYSPARIRAGVSSLARRIREDLASLPESGPGPTFVVLLKGGARFAFDLLGRYREDYCYEFIGVSSYGRDTASSGRVEFYHYRPDRELIDGRVIVLLDDICDSGNTMKEVAGRLGREFSPRLIRTCALIWRENGVFRPDYYAFRTAESSYFVGYGLGLGEEYRHLDSIFALENGRIQAAAVRKSTD